MKTPKLLPCVVACACASLSGADAAFQFVDTSPIRSLAGSETNEWDVFTSANISFGSNLGDVSNTSGATVSQTNDGVAILTSGGNIYAPSAAITIEVNDSPSYVDVGNGVFVGNVVLQFSTFGAVHDAENVIFSYTDSLANTQQLAASGFQQSTSFVSFPVPGGGTAMAAEEESAYQWDLTGLNAVSFTIEIPAEGSSMSLDKLVLDTVPTTHGFSQVVIPEPGSSLLVLSGLASLLMRRQRGGSPDGSSHGSSTTATTHE